MNLNELLDIVIRFRDERDWKKFHNPKDLAISISIEANELLQHFQWVNGDDVWRVARSRREEIAEEMADILIYLLYLADVMGIDVERAFLRKVEKNAERYPVEKAKGVAKKYTEL